jgi:hypothetical protein
MNSLIFKTLSIIPFLFFTSLSKADSWIDPEWKQMIDHSEIIAKVKFTITGDFRAKAKILSIYKGQIDRKEIWISNFSNRFGPIDTKYIGDKYIVFLLKAQITEQGRDYVNKKKNELIDEDDRDYYESLLSGNVYNVWSPTSGDLLIRDKYVQYNLFQTTYYLDQTFYPLNEFELFIKTFFNPNKNNFHRFILKKLVTLKSNEHKAQYLMMLHLSDYNNFNPIFYELSKTNDKNINYALAKLLGQIAGEQSKNILAELLKNNNRIVKGEAAIQLSKENPEIIGPILLEALDIAIDDDINPPNLMYPVMTQMNGGAQIEIIKALGKLNYKPAIPILLPLLKTKDTYLFNTIIEVLIQLDTKEYIAYLNDHLESCNMDLIFDISKLIVKNNLVECIPSLKYFIANHDRTFHPSAEFTISKYLGLAYFPTDTVKKFLYYDFKRLLNTKDNSSSEIKAEWIRTYLNVFNDLEITIGKDYLYNCMFDYFGFDHNFKLDTSMFRIKKLFEDSIQNHLTNLFQNDSVESIQALALMNKSFDTVSLMNYTARLNIFNRAQLDYIWQKLEQSGVNRKNIILAVGNSTYSYGAKKIRPFMDLLMREFLRYLIIDPDNNDIIFVENLQKYTYAVSTKEIELLEKFIYEAKEKINIR